MRRCETPYCLNDAAPGRKVCRKCESRKYRKENPHVATFNILRYNAKRRGIDFGLTIAEWTQWCDETGYLELRGTGINDMTVDRKMEDIGYIYSNLQMLTKADNIKKHFEWKRKKKGWSVELKKASEDPF